MRFTKSFLLSLNLHIWGIGLFSLVWVLARPEKPPERIEVKFFKLPRAAAQVEGETVLPPELVGIEGVKDEDEVSSYRIPGVTEAQEKASPSPPHALRALGPHTTRSPGQSSVQPLVTYRVRIAKDKPDLKLVSRASGSMDADSHYVPLSEHAVRPSREVVLASAGHRPDRISDEVSFKGDTRPLLEIIQARIDAVTPLAHATAIGCKDQSGIVKIAFLIDTLGYPCGMRILSSSGSPCLDDEVDNVLHLAEPYPYVAGWVPVTVRFTL